MFDSRRCWSSRTYGMMASQQHHGGSAVPKFLALFILFSGITVSAKPIQATDLFRALLFQPLKAQKLNWQVGDRAEYKVLIGKTHGKLLVSVHSQSKKGFWVMQTLEMDLSNTHRAEVLYDGKTGEIKEFHVNGRMKPVSVGDKSDVVELKEKRFRTLNRDIETLYAKYTNSSKGQSGETWVNSNEVPISGIIRTEVSGLSKSVAMEISSFEKNTVR